MIGHASPVLGTGPKLICTDRPGQSTDHLFPGDGRTFPGDSRSEATSPRETTFHMIKSKFGDSLRSKTKTAQINEALCKVLCHNICCLIQSMFELNVKPEFWTEAA